MAPEMSKGKAGQHLEIAALSAHNAEPWLHAPESEVTHCAMDAVRFGKPARYLKDCWLWLSSLCCVCAMPSSINRSIHREIETYAELMIEAWRPGHSCWPFRVPPPPFSSKIGARSVPSAVHLYTAQVPSPNRQSTAVFISLNFFAQNRCAKVPSFRRRGPSPMRRCTATLASPNRRRYGG